MHYKGVTERRRNGEMRPAAYVKHRIGIPFLVERLAQVQARPAPGVCRPCSPHAENATALARSLGILPP
jgi:hypothetical protein